MLDMEPPFEKHLFVDCVFAEQMFDERSFAAYPGEQQFDLSSPISSPLPSRPTKRASL